MYVSTSLDSCRFSSNLRRVRADGETSHIGTPHLSMLPSINYTGNIGDRNASLRNVGRCLNSMNLIDVRRVAL